VVGLLEKGPFSCGKPSFSRRRHLGLAILTHRHGEPPSPACRRDGHRVGVTLTREIRHERASSGNFSAVRAEWHTECISLSIVASAANSINAVVFLRTARDEIEKGGAR
jgi:hypothetical protein